MRGRPRAIAARAAGSRAGILADQRGFVTAFFVKLALVLILVGITAVETGAIIFARLQTNDVAETASAVAAGSYRDNRVERAASQAAERAVAEKDPSVEIESFQVNRRDGTVEITVTKQASTILVQHIGFLEGLATAKGTAVGEPPVA